MTDNIHHVDVPQSMYASHVTQSIMTLYYAHYMLEHQVNNIFYHNISVEVT